MRKVERLKSIEQVIARSQLEDAELELKGLNERRANLDRANRKPEALLAPVDGVIASANAVAGQIAEPNAIVFQIVDPTRLWVEALSFEPQATNSAAQGVLGDGRTMPLKYLGTGLADRNQSVPIHFAVKGEAKGLRAGQFVTVLATTRRNIAASHCRAKRFCAAPMARASSTSTPMPSASSRAKSASSRSTARACWCAPASRPASAS